MYVLQQNIQRQQLPIVSFEMNAIHCEKKWINNTIVSFQYSAIAFTRISSFRNVEQMNLFCVDKLLNNNKHES